MREKKKVAIFWTNAVYEKEELEDFVHITTNYIWMDPPIRVIRESEGVEKGGHRL